jgi:hypothetical protein
MNELIGWRQDRYKFPKSGQVPLSVLGEAATGVISALKLTSRWQS